MTFNFVAVGCGLISMATSFRYLALGQNFEAARR